MDETGLYWKRRPDRSYISKEEKLIPSYKAAKDRLTLLFGGNASGEPKRYTMQEMASGFSLFEEALLVFEAQDLNVEWYKKAAAAVQNAIQCLCVFYDEKKRATTQTLLDRFFKRVDRIESRKEPEPVALMSGVSEIAACPPSPIADDPSALPSPTSSPSSSR